MIDIKNVLGSKIDKMKNSHNKHPFLYDLKHNKAIICMLIMPMAILLVFNYLPIYGVQIAFRDYNVFKPVWDSPWVGLKYFKKFFTYYKTPSLFKNTVIINLYDILLTPIPVFFAVCLYYCPSTALRKITTYFSLLPNYISTVILCALIQNFCGPNGPISIALSSMGYDRINFLTQASVFRHAYVWSGLWSSCGFSAIIYTTVLEQTSRQQHDVATLEGATFLQHLWYIDIPSILPLYTLNLVFRFGAILSNNYEKMLLLRNNCNLKYSSTIATYSYDLVFGNTFAPQYSMSAAVGMVSAILNLFLLILVRESTKRAESMDE